MRLERDTARLSHCGLVPVRDVAVDFVMSLPAGGLVAPLAGPGEMTLLPGAVPGTVHLERGGRLLGIGDAPYPIFDRDRPGVHETLFVVPDDQVEALRDLLSHAWVRGDNAEVLQPADIALAPGPVLVLGPVTMGLAPIGLDPADPDCLTLPLPGGTLTLRRVPGSRLQTGELALRPRDPAEVPAAAGTAAFHAQSPARLVLQAPSELAMPPILGSLGDRDFIYRRAAPGQAASYGRHTLAGVVVREGEKFVLPDGPLAGLIFDATGISNARDHAAALDGKLPAPFAREGGCVFLDRSLLDTAPTLPGPHAVMPGGAARDDGTWLTAAMVPLCLMAPLLPAGITLLLPRQDDAEVLDAFGFGALNRRVMTGQICRVEEIYWPATGTIDVLPASAFAAARDRAMAGRPAPGPARRIFIKRRGTRAVANQAAMDDVLGKHHFETILLDDLTLTRRIELFRQAEMVVATHGAGMENMLFCAAGTKVLELSPECQYRPFLNQLCGKLGLSHALLPCATDDGGFDGGLTVPPYRLGLMLHMLSVRQAA